jgi:phage-related minor tail protein
MNRTEALRNLAGDKKWEIRGGVLNWFDDLTQPPEEQIQAKIAELTAAEPMRQLRIQRDQLLSATDWWCVSDRTATTEQLAYRQALRDLPANSIPALDENGNLTGVTWPNKPE